VPRYPWHELPPAVRAEVEDRTGPVIRVTPVETGVVSDVAVILETPTGRVFCKGVAADNSMGWMHRNEARMNAHLPPPMPRLLWQIEGDGWLLLAFEYVSGRHPDLTPGSPDLPGVAAALSDMAIALTPCPAAEVQPAAARWAGYIPAEMIDGDTLVHTDVTPYNFLVHEGGVTLVDWSMPCRGAAWIDTALMVVRLIRAGHAPEQAEAWAGRVPVWSNARHEAVDAFAAGIATLSREREQQRPSAAHLGPLADAAATWRRHRSKPRAEGGSVRAQQAFADRDGFS
jgi:RIO1 family